MPDGLLAGGLDEMVSGDGRIRPHWRGLMGLIGSLGRPALVERAERLSRAQAEEGPASLLPGAVPTGWRLDPLPLALAPAEFEALAAGIAQRAGLLETLLADLYGPQQVLADGLLPPDLVYGGGAFLRAARRANGPPRRPFLHLYAADLVRDAAGRWAVLQDRTTLATGLGQVRENRRLLTAALPEAFRAAPPRHVTPFFDLWQQALGRLAPRGRPDPAVALLSGGTRDPHWFEHVVLSRELGCALVEPGDLTVRGGALWLKTLGGLQSIEVLLSRLPSGALDPLDQPEADAATGIPGLFDAARHGALTIVNAPGAALAEAPALSAHLHSLAPRLIGEALALPSLPTWHLRRGEELPRLPEGHAAWLRRPASDGTHRGELQGTLPWDGAGLAATALPPLPAAPSLGAGGFAPQGIVLRLFAVSDGHRWEVLPGGLSRVMEPGAPLVGRLPAGGRCKDVWVGDDDSSPRLGPAAQAGPPLPIRRTGGAIPSRVADNVFWLGRYVERLDRAARLMRATIARMRRGSPSPLELAELATLAVALAEAGLIPAEAHPSGGTLGPLAEGLRREAVPAVRGLHERIAQLTDSVRDRLTADMHATFTQSLRLAEGGLGAQGEDLAEIARALVPSLRLATAVAGVAAENMVQSGARLFLELGRRIERAQAVAAEVAAALDVPPPRIEGGLRLTLELCDSVITYRSRYLSVLQPAPALDLVLADPSNPRGLAFQLTAIERALREVAGEEDTDLAEEAAALLAQVEGLPARLLAAPDQAREAASLPPLLRGIAQGIRALSDRVTRRHFALLPPARAVGVDVAELAVAP
ncbi:MAG: circularly permuted type 2 ATP-grasp protein [Acetobacteraceae bacterium]|nr:circularly permuted type 2 ATP-grasp protein [Acetobacteraceae bacterium]